MTSTNLYYKLLLIIVLITGFYLRVHNLSTNPPELFTDELANFTSARSIIETGHDLDGNLLPYFSDRVEYRPPIYGYLSYFSTLIIGNNTFAIRFPAVLLGLLTIFLLYIWVLKTTESEVASLGSAFIYDQRVR